MISAAVLCAHPPLLFRELSGTQDPAAGLRAAAVAAVRELTTGADAVVVVGGAAAAADWDPALPVDVRGFGTTGARTPSALPLSLGVGMRLLYGAGWTGPVELVTAAWHSDDEAVDSLAASLAARPGGTVLLLMGDGSARRGGAPGHLDERAASFDAAIAQALAEGDAQALRDLDVPLADELMVSGCTSLRVLGALAVAQGAVLQAGLSYCEDPFGVGYFVATWTLGGPGK